MAEGRGKAQADSLRKARREIAATRLVEARRVTPPRRPVSSSLLAEGDLVLVEAGEFIPADGEVVAGAASVDESAITGESAPVIRESGGDRSAVTGGTRVLSDWLVVRVTAQPGETFLDRMIAMVEGAKRQKTPNEIALNILLAALTIIFLVVVVTLRPMSQFSVDAAGKGDVVSITVLVALLVCLAPTTIGALLSAIGIAGMNRLSKANVVAMSGARRRSCRRRGRAPSGQDRHHHPGQPPGDRVHARPRCRTRRNWPTPPNWPPWPTRHPRAAASSCWPRTSTACAAANSKRLGATFVPFTAQTRMSGVDLDGRDIRKGAADAIEAYVRRAGRADAGGGGAAQWRP